MSKKSTNNIKTAFFLNLGFSIFELIGGIYTNSVSITSDSVHDFGDALSIAIAWGLEKKSEKTPNKNYTYGYKRFSLVGALITSIVLIIGSVIMLYNAIPRLINPERVDYNGILILAVIGFIVNGLGAYKTARGNVISEKVVSLHLLEDVLGWAAVLISGIIMKFFDLPILDPILCIFITAFILFNVFRNVKSIFEVFLEKAPDNIDIDSTVNELLENEKIVEMHHIHFWSADSVIPYITLHVKIVDGLSQSEIIDIKEFIRDKFKEKGINHVTLEIGFESENCESIECMPEKTESHSHLGHHHH